MPLICREQDVTLGAAWALVFAPNPNALYARYENRGTCPIFAAFDPYYSTQRQTLNPGDTLEMSIEEDGDAVNLPLYGMASSGLVGTVHVTALLPAQSG